MHDSPHFHQAFLRFIIIVTVYLKAVNAYLIAVTVNFDQPNYTVNETDETLRLIVFLSNPSSTNIPVQVSSTDVSATGKQLTISCTIIK